MAHGIVTEELRNKVLKLHSQGWYNWEIAKELNIPEAIVVKILNPRI